MINQEVTEKQKLACILAVLPVLMDYMEDIKYKHPKLYRQQIKRAGNEFIKEVDKLGFNVYKLVEENPETEQDEFAQQIIDMGEAFKKFVKYIDD